MDIFSNKINVEWNTKLDCLCINTKNEDDRKSNLISIKSETLENMSFKEACEFVGGDVLLLIPAVRKLFAEELDISKDQIDNTE